MLAPQAAGLSLLNPDELPEWIPAVANDGGQRSDYWYNRRTRQTQWDPPFGAVDAVKRALFLAETKRAARTIPPSTVPARGTPQQNALSATTGAAASATTTTTTAARLAAPRADPRRGKHEEEDDEDYDPSEPSGRGASSKKRKAHQGDEAEDFGADPAPDATTPTKVTRLPPKASKNAFQLFGDAHRATIRSELLAAQESQEHPPSMAQVQRVLGSRWNALSEEERAPWRAKAEEDKVRYEAEMTTWKAEVAGDQDKEGGASLDAPAAGFGSHIPINRVLTITKLDPDVNKIASEAVRCLTQAAEMFIQEMAREALVRGDRKRIKLQDIHHVVYADEARFGFLSTDFESPAELDLKEAAAARALKANDARRKSEQTRLLGQQTAGGAGSIATFFAKGAGGGD